MSNKHHAICKSKTLDVPIIITNDYDVASSNNPDNTITNGSPVTSPTAVTPSVAIGSGVFIPPLSLPAPSATTTTTFNKFQKGYSLDSQFLCSQNSLSSSSSLVNSSSNSISSSTSNSTQNVSGNHFNHQHRQFLQPPSSLSSSQAQNINADFVPTTVVDTVVSRVYERCPPPNSTTTSVGSERKLSENLEDSRSSGSDGSKSSNSSHLI
jgi:hypothetical protein